MAWAIGWPDVAIHDGGWFEWSADPSNPVAVGDPAAEAATPAAAPLAFPSTGSFYGGLAPRRRRARAAPLV